MNAPVSDTFVSVVASLHNDAQIVLPFVRELHALLEAHYVNYEIVLVDDGSTDRTALELSQVLETLGCLRVLRLSRSFGRDAALLAGMDSCIGDFIVLMSPETDPPALIPDLVQRCRAAGGVVVARPRNIGPQPLWAGITSAIFHEYCRRILKVDLQPGARTYFCLSRAALNAVLAVRSRVWHLRYLAGIVGFDSETVAYDRIARSGRALERSFVEDLSSGIGIVLSNSKHPLRLASLLGLMASGINLLYMGYVVVVYLLKRDVQPGWTTQSLQISVMFFLVFVILTVLSEYVALVLEESQRRPAYFLAAEMNSNVVLRDTNRRNVVTQSI